MRGLQDNPWSYYDGVDNRTCLFPTMEGSGQYSYNAAVRRFELRAMTWSGDAVATNDPYTDLHCTALTLSDTRTFLGDTAGTEFKGRGILNGTTNYILTEMSKRIGYQAALKETQRLGYAEAKPDADVEGWDALAKMVILANVLMGGDVKMAGVERKVITGLDISDIEEAREEGKRWKLIARAWREGDKLRAKVGPEKMGPEDFLAHVGGVLNALIVDIDVLGEVTLIGPGAGECEAGFALLSDMLNIHRSLAGQ